MMDIHDRIPSAQSLRIAVPCRLAGDDSGFRELAALVLDVIEARLASGDVAIAAVNEVVETAFGGSGADTGRIVAAILTCLSLG